MSGSWFITAPKCNVLLVMKKYESALIKDFALYLKNILFFVLYHNSSTAREKTVA